MPAEAAALTRQLDWLDSLDSGPLLPAAPPASSLRVAAFNVERGSRYGGILSLLRTHAALRDVDVVLLNEVDWGMARSANRHVARDLAAELGMHYVFGIEFLELTKGEHRELDAPGDNTWSLHGNAILSRLELRQARLLRLPLHCSWAAGSQMRLGGRMALLAEVALGSGTVTLATVHLENRTSPAGRCAQLTALLDELGAHSYAILGGDLNSATVDAGKDEELFSVGDLLAAEPLRFRRPQAYEPLFEAARSAGFDVDAANPPDVATSIPMGIPDPTYWLKLDWLFSRGLAMTRPQVVPAVQDGERVSDHDCVVATFYLP